MECPKCQSEMETVTHQGIEVNRCTHCRGLWLDMMDRERLKAIDGSETVDDGDPAVGRRYNQIDRIDCPVCRTQMIRMVDPQQSHIWFESCGTCHGVFFDAGEFTDYRKQTVADIIRDIFTPERR